jgi:hypothetical protein
MGDQSRSLEACPPGHHFAAAGGQFLAGRQYCHLAASTPGQTFACQEVEVDRA